MGAAYQKVSPMVPKIQYRVNYHAFLLGMTVYFVYILDTLVESCQDKKTNIALASVSKLLTGAV